MVTSTTYPRPNFYFQRNLNGTSARVKKTDGRDAGVIMRKRLKIMVKLGQGSIQVVEILPTDRLSAIKRHVEDREGIQVEDQRIIYGAVELLRTTGI